MEPSSNQPIEFILTCSCQGAPETAVKAFSVVFPEKQHPVMLTGAKQILDESNRHPDTPLGEFLKGISKNKEKFIYYIKYDGQSVELWDLRKGIRIP